MGDHGIDSADCYEKREGKTGEILSGRKQDLDSMVRLLLFTVGTSIDELLLTLNSGRYKRKFLPQGRVPAILLFVQCICSIE